MKVKLMQYAGFAFAVIVSGGATLWGEKYPFVTVLSYCVVWLLGKLLGQPLTSIVIQTLANMKPDKATAVAMTALSSSIPPAAAGEVAHNLISAMPLETAQALKPIILRSLPPAAAERFTELQRNQSVTQLNDKKGP